uniref:Uncharacterized protein n=1 Tax=Scleropages formosus TaxID=113540 RepID=A0A8C9RT79_SCLFO
NKQPLCVFVVSSLSPLKPTQAAVPEEQGGGGLFPGSEARGPSPAHRGPHPGLPQPAAPLPCVCNIVFNLYIYLPKQYNRFLSLATHVN